jgi:small GTP-binding protein
MGAAWTRLMQTFFGNKQVKILLLGLDNAGKTTTLYKITMNEVVLTAPTVGYNVEQRSYGNVNFVMWDLGGQDSARATWSSYFPTAGTACALVIVADSTDKSRLPILRIELERLLMAEELKGSPVLVFANKQDLKGALNAAELSETLGLPAIRDRAWHIQPSCALTGQGLDAGMQWLAQTVVAASS